LLVGCDNCAKNDAAQKATEVTVDHIVPEKVISAWGYRTVSTDKRTQSAWENDTFGSATIRIQSIKAVKEVPDWKNAYYRFTIVEETFENADLARARSERLKDHDPQLDSKCHPELILRDGFFSANKVIYVTTDVSKFELEQMPTIVALLKAHILKKTKAKTSK